MNEVDLTHGNIAKKLAQFALPYLATSFLQVSYGMIDLYIVGQFASSKSISAVSIISSVFHMLTVVVAGLSMGVTVTIAQAQGRRDDKSFIHILISASYFFAIISAILTLIIYLLHNIIIRVMLTPAAAIDESRRYFSICIFGIPFIVLYNAFSAAFRGRGDSRSPLLFVAAASFINIILDYVFVAICKMEAAGAATATVISQIISCIVSAAFLFRGAILPPFTKCRALINRKLLIDIIKIGVPIAAQDGLIQISFLVITIIANNRGLVASCAVGITEKIICFLFLFPSSFCQAVASVTAQNIGANKKERAISSLQIGIIITSVWGAFWAVYCAAKPLSLTAIFTSEKDVAQAAAEYLRTYGSDVFFAAAHFCFSGYFTGSSHSNLSFLHNIISASCVRIPLAALASYLYPASLLYMGAAAPLGSLFSSLLCVVFFLYQRTQENRVTSM